MIEKELYKKIAENMPIICVDGIIIKDGQYLLVRRKNEPLKDHWWVPGGRVKRGERLTEAFYRKIKEEVGLDVQILGEAHYYEDFFEDNDLGLDYKHTISFVFIARPVGEQKVVLDSQSSKFRWADRLPPKFEEQAIFKKELKK